MASSTGKSPLTSNQAANLLRELMKMRQGNAAAVQKAAAQKGETNKIQNNSVRVVGTKQQMENSIIREHNKNINTDGAARARAMEAKLKASSSVRVINSNPVKTVEAPSTATPGKLGGAYAGGHGISEEEMAAGGKPLSAMDKLGSAGRIGARMATEEDLLP